MKNRTVHYKIKAGKNEMSPIFFVYEIFIILIYFTNFYKVKKSYTIKINYMICIIILKKNNSLWDFTSCPVFVHLIWK